MTARATVTRLALLAELTKRVKAADAEQRAAALDFLDAGERLVAKLPDGTEVGRVRVDHGSASAYVADDQTLLAWVRAHHPTEVETVPAAQRVRASFVAKLLTDVKDGGGVDAGTGEPVPGVDVRQGEPKVVVVTTKDERQAIADAWAAGRVSVADLIQPALPAAGEAA